MNNASIGWTNHTLEPWQGSGRLAPRMFATDEQMALPVAWNRQAALMQRRQRVLCMSKGDLFEWHDIPLGAMLQANYRARVFELIERTPWLDWMLPTRWPENLAPMLPSRWRNQMPSNVWLGTHIQDQARAEVRLPVFLDAVYGALGASVSVVFVSCKPLLSDIDLEAAAPNYEISHAIDLVITGEESGLHARAADLDWFRSLRDQCQRFDIAFCLEQLCQGGRALPLPFLDGRRWAQLPESAALNFPARSAL